MTDFIIRCQNLGRFFKEGSSTLKVLHQLEFAMPRGIIGVIMGRSGSGKSTLLNLLGGLDQPSEGEVFFGEQSLYKMKTAELDHYRSQKLGFVFQFHHLLPEFSLLENVMLPSRIQGTWNKEQEERAKELLQKVGLENRLTHLPSQTSGGERQRAAVARALINNPDLVMMDEPSGNLDSYNAQKLHEMILQLNQDLKQTFLIVTHDTDFGSMASHKWELLDSKITPIE